MPIALMLLSLTAICQNPLLLKDVFPGNNPGTIQQIVKTTNYSFFTEDDDDPDSDRSLFRTDGTSAGTIKLNLTYPGYISTKAEKLTPLGNKVIFAGDNFANYGEIWASDGTQAGTVAIERFMPTTAGVVPVVELNAMGSYVYYSAVNSSNQAILKRTDGTIAGTSEVYNFGAYPGIPEVVFLTPINNVLYFILYDVYGTGVDQLWRSDGTTAGTYMVYDFTTAAFVEGFIMPMDNYMYIMIGSIVGGVRQNTIWKSDGTTAGTAPLKFIGTGNTNLYPPFKVIGSTMYFAGADGNGKELWKTDGTAAGTVRVTDINPGSGSSNPTGLTALNNQLYFSAANGTNGIELWKYDGAGTASLVKDINPGLANGGPSGLTLSGSSIIFSANDGTAGPELWITDGTSANTLMITDLNPGATGSNPNTFTAGNPVYFAANNGTSGFEVFKYDNTAGINGLHKVYVNDNSTSGDVFTTAVGNNSNQGTSNAPFATINHAISMAQPGDTIMVDAGTYTEAVVVNKQLIIRGAKYGQDPGSSLNRGNESIIMPAVNNTGFTGMIIKPAADSITIDGFTLDGDNPSISGGVLVNGVDVNGGLGIYNDGAIAAYLTVKNNIVKNTATYGIGLFRSLGNTTGPVVPGAAFMQNRVDNIGSRGIVLAYSAYGNIINNHISRCGTSGTWFSQQNVANIGNAPAIIGGNIIEQCTLGMQSSSLQINSSAVYYLNNEITGLSSVNSFGLSLLLSNSSGILANNNKMQNIATGVYINSSNAANPIQVINNSILASQRSVQSFNANTVTATCNWFGSVEAEAVAAKIDGAGIIYTPWLMNGTDNNAARGFQPVPGSCNGRQNKFYVNDNSQSGDVYTTAVGNNANNGFSTAPFATITYAISVAQSGDTIIVDAGTYAERIVVNKSLYIKGAYNGTNPGASLSRGASESIILPSIENNLQELVTVSVSNVTIDGFLFDGDNPSITGSITLNGVDVNAGMGIYNANVQTDNLVVKHNIFKNFYRYAVFVQKSTGSITGTNISRNRVDNVSSRAGRDGRAISFFANAYGSITENNLTRVHAGIFIANHNAGNDSLIINGNSIEAYNNGMYLYLLNGISSSITVTNNNVSLADLNTWNAPGSSNVNVCTGINMLYFATDKNVRVENNIVTGTNVGIGVTQSTAAGFVISNNSITQTPSYAINHVFPLMPLTATCNWYGTAAAHGVNNEVSGVTNFIPWLVNGTDNDIATGFQPLPGTCTGTPVDVTFDASTNVSCFAGNNGSASITVSGGTAPYNFNWSRNGVGGYSSVEDPANLLAGTYSLLLTDANGSIDSLTGIIITEPAILNATATGTSTSCSNSVTVVADGGTAPYTYLWSNGATTDTVTNIPAGTYFVTVTDHNGCTDTASVTVTANEAFNPSAAVSNVSCYGGSNGSITVTNVNSVAPFSFSIDGINFVPGTLPYSFNGLTAGTYNIAVRDGNGCTGFVTKTVNQPAQLTAVLNNVRGACYGQSTGSISVTASGGSGALGYSWTGPNGFTSVQRNINGLASGNYTLTVTDNNGCTANLNVVVPSFNEITVSAAITNVLCRNTASGAIDLTVSGGSGNFGFAWSGGSTATTEDISNLSANNYNVTITDLVSGCQVTRPYSITQPAANLSLSTTKTNATACNSLGTITAAGAGGTSPYQYRLGNGALQSSGLFTNLYGGTYVVWVQDANGCTTSKEVIITDNGGDQYESNNSKNQAKPILIDSLINARIATAADVADWFRFVTPAGGGNFILHFTHPSAAFTYNMYASGNNTPALVPVNTTATSKEYVLSGNATYYINVTGGLSYVCYSLIVSPPTSFGETITTVKDTKLKETAVVVEERSGLKATAYPNPHQGSFSISIASPETGTAKIDLFTVNGQKLQEKTVTVQKTGTTTVPLHVTQTGTIFYRVQIGKYVTTGKVIGGN